MDEEILALIKNKNQDGLSLLVDRYGGLMAYIVRNAGLTNDEDVSECMSDILFTIWKRIKKFDDSRSSFKTWLIIVTRGCAIDFLRKNKKHKGVVSLEVVGEPYTEELASAGIDYNHLLELLQELPPPDNEIFFRRFVLGESVAEIARLLGLTEDNIYKRVLRGKSKLKALMEREGYCYG